MEEYCVNTIILPYSKVITVDISRIMKLGDIDNEYHIVTKRHRELATYFFRVLQISVGDQLSTTEYTLLSCTG